MKKLTGIKLIAIERQEQIKKHGRTIKKDIKLNDHGQLHYAATVMLDYLGREESFIPTGWNKDIWNKMIKKDKKERLIIAGALIAAELDRLNALNAISKCDI
jgi:hypothetical protein